MSSRNSLTSAHPAYTCSWRFFWTGLKDYVFERTVSKPSSSQSSGASKSLLGGLGMAVLFICTLAAIVAQAAPWLATSTSVLSPHRLAQLSIGAAMAGALFVGVGVPVWVGWRTWRFAKAMCRRGWELSCGARQPFRP